MAHIRAYKDWMAIHNHQDKAMCKAFPPTLAGVARTWYGKLRSCSIDNFQKLGSKFVTHFLVRQVKSKSTNSIFSITQGAGESLLSYTKRFHATTLSIDNFQKAITLNAFREGLQPEAVGTFSYKISKKPYATYTKAYREAF